MHTFEQRNEMRHYRRVFAEMPIGDPTSGAAYGEYLKSKALGLVIGVVSAVAAVWTGGASLAAMSASGAWSVGSALSAGAMVAGGVMSGVGAVTGNKKLMKIGGVLGRVNTALILGLAYLVIFIPLGLLLRLFGKDALKKRWREDVTTYRRVKPPRPASHMERQF